MRIMNCPNCGHNLIEKDVQQEMQSRREHQKKFYQGILSKIRTQLFQAYNKYGLKTGIEYPQWKQIVFEIMNKNK